MGGLVDRGCGSGYWFESYAARGVDNPQVAYRRVRLFYCRNLDIGAPSCQSGRHNVDCGLDRFGVRWSRRVQYGATHSAEQEGN